MFSLAVEPHFIKIYFLPTLLVERLQMDFFSFSSFPSPTLRYKDYIYVFILGTENAMCVCVRGGGGWGWVRGSFASMPSCFTLHHISASFCWVGQTRINILCEVSQHIFILVNYQPVNTRRGIVQNCTWISASVRFLFVHRCVCWCEGERRAISKILSSITQQ